MTTPDNKHFIVFDDKSMLRDRLIQFLERMDHLCVGQEASVPAALGLIDELANNNIHVDVAFIDGDFTEGKHNGSEGEQISVVIRDKMPNTYVIAMSVNKMTWSDFPNISKSSSPIEIGEMLKNLPPKMLNNPTQG